MGKFHLRRRSPAYGRTISKAECYLLRALASVASAHRRCGGWRRKGFPPSAQPQALLAADRRAIRRGLGSGALPQPGRGAGAPPRSPPPAHRVLHVLTTRVSLRPSEARTAERKPAQRSPEPRRRRKGPPLGKNHDPPAHDTPYPRGVHLARLSATTAETLPDPTPPTRQTPKRLAPGLGPGRQRAPHTPSSRTRMHTRKAGTRSEATPPRPRRPAKTPPGARPWSLSHSWTDGDPDSDPPARLSFHSRENPVRLTLHGLNVCHEWRHRQHRRPEEQRPEIGRTDTAREQRERD